MPNVHRCAFFLLHKEKSNISGVVWHQVVGRGAGGALKVTCLSYVKSLGFEGVFLCLENDSGFT